MANNGKMICAMGIPASGKSSIIRELEYLFNEEAIAFFEPEENDPQTPWPRAVSMRQKYGFFGSITWFRAMRVPQLYDAYDVKQSGKIALVDSYYDKILVNYLGKDGLDWFLPRNDPYFSIVKSMAEQDYISLPNADVIIFFRVSEQIWNYFYKKRNRNMDQEEIFRKQCFSLQFPMIEACKKYADDYQKKLLIFDQEIVSPHESARKLKLLLEELS